MKTNNVVLRKIQLRKVDTFQETNNNSKTTKIQPRNEKNHIFRRSLPHLEKPAHLVARVTDHTSVQRTYRGLWRPNEYSQAIITERFAEPERHTTQKRRFGERFLTQFVLFAFTFFNFIGIGTTNKVTQAGSLLLCLGAVYILLYSIFSFTYMCIVDYILLIIKMAICSTDCLEVLLQHFILTNSVAISIYISIALLIGFVSGAAMMKCWMKRNHRNEQIPVLQRDNFDVRIIQNVSEKITDYCTLRSLAITLNINVYYLYATYNDNSRIWDVSFKVLYDWVQKQAGGLHPGCQGLAELKSALHSIQKAAWVRDIEELERSYNNR